MLASSARLRAGIAEVFQLALVSPLPIISDGRNDAASPEAALLRRAEIGAQRARAREGARGSAARYPLADICRRGRDERRSWNQKVGNLSDYGVGCELLRFLTFHQLQRRDCCRSSGSAGRSRLELSPSTSPPHMFEVDVAETARLSHSRNSFIPRDREV